MSAIETRCGADATAGRAGARRGSCRAAVVAALVVATSIGGVLVAQPPAAATATYLCKGYDACANAGKSHYGYKTGKTSSYWKMTAGNNCTNYVAYRYVKRTYDAMPNTRPWSGDGNAYSWGPLNAAKRDGTPKVGATAWWGKSGSLPYGHVAYVERVVSSSEIIVSESNWGGNPEFAWRKITKSGGGWPNGFIHFKDERLLSTSAPTISGTPKVGVALSVKSKGSWRSSSRSSLLSGVPVTYSYVWYADGKAISGATKSTFTPTASQRGKRIKVKVKASASGYKAGEKTSGSTATVAPGTLKATRAPVVTGTAEVGSTLAVASGAWSPSPTEVRVQWLADGLAIADATTPELVLTDELVGKVITVQETAIRTGYTTATSTSGPTLPVAAPVAAPSS